MAWAHVQSNSAFSDASAANIPVANGSVTVGNLIVVSFSWGQGSGNPTGVSDTVGSSFQQIGTTINDSGNGQSFAMYAALAAASGSNTVTPAFATSIFRRVVVSEYSGISSATPVAANQRALFTASTATDNATTAPNSVTPTVAGQLVVCAVMETNNSTEDFTAGTGFAKRAEDADTTGGVIATEDIAAPSTAAINGTWTLSAASTLHVSAYIAVFAESGGGGSAQQISTPTFQAIPFMGGH